MNEFQEKPTGAQRTIERETFYCWKVGICQTEWRNIDGTLRVWANPSFGSYSASVDNKVIGRRYRRSDNAMRDAVRTRNALAGLRP